MWIARQAGRATTPPGRSTRLKGPARREHGAGQALLFTGLHTSAWAPSQKRLCGCANVCRRCEARGTSLATVQRRSAARARHKRRAGRRPGAGRQRRRRRSPPAAQRLAGRRCRRRRAAAAAAVAAVAAGRAVRGQRGAGLLPRGARGGRGLGGRRRLGGRLRGAPAAPSGMRHTKQAPRHSPGQAGPPSILCDRGAGCHSRSARLDLGCAWTGGARRPCALG